mgnify:CR=1 FL=1|jgi:two-component system aerobic respiration control sensor histidine kinase ArcB
MEGNGYSVTWALGHLVQLALPGTEALSAYRALLKNETINDKILNEHTRQIMDYAAILIKVAEAEIKRMTNETEDTDS